jgi:hypothetical protein
MRRSAKAIWERGMPSISGVNGDEMATGSGCPLLPARGIWARADELTLNRMAMIAVFRRASLVDSGFI